MAAKYSANLTLESMRSVSLLILVVFMIIFSQYVFSKLPMFARASGPTQAAMGLLGGLVVALAAYLPIKYLYGKLLVDESFATNLAVLLGLLTSYMMISGRGGMPDIQTIALLVFLFYNQVDKFMHK